MDYLKIYNTLDSTNLEAQRLLANGPVQNGLTILALNQTHGRGQMGRTWIAQPGEHLSMTIIFYPQKMDPGELSTLGMKISLGIVNGLLSIDPGQTPLIKWPNDIYVHGKKLCGILIENALSGGRVQHSIIGIGINVNEDSFPPDIPNAVSLHMLTGTRYDIQEIALRIRQHVLATLESTSLLWKESYDLHVFGKDKSYSFISGDHTFNARVESISVEGHLQLITDSGEQKSYASHEVRWVIG